MPRTSQRARALQDIDTAMECLIYADVLDVSGAYWMGVVFNYLRNILHVRVLLPTCTSLQTALHPPGLMHDESQISESTQSGGFQQCQPPCSWTTWLGLLHSRTTSGSNIQAGGQGINELLSTWYTRAVGTQRPANNDRLTYNSAISHPSLNTLTSTDNIAGLFISQH